MTGFPESDACLDAVFYPNIYKKEEIFRQEGLELSSGTERRTAEVQWCCLQRNERCFSSPDDVLEREIMNSLFPDTTYGCGPAEIL